MRPTGLAGDKVSSDDFEQGTDRKIIEYSRDDLCRLLDTLHLISGRTAHSVVFQNDNGHEIPLADFKEQFFSQTQEQIDRAAEDLFATAELTVLSTYPACRVISQECHEHGQDTSEKETVAHIGDVMARFCATVENEGPITAFWQLPDVSGLPDIPADFNAKYIQPAMLRLDSALDAFYGEKV